MLISPLLLSPASRGREIIKRLPYVHPSVCLSRFCINLNISFIYEDIFTKFAGNVYGYENLSLKNFSLILKKKVAAIANCLNVYGYENLSLKNFSLILKNKVAAIANCLKILKVL